MTAESVERVPGDRFGTVVMVIAVLISLFVTTVLVSANAYARQKVIESRIRATIVPASGKLLGVNALDGSEWLPPKDKERTLVLFGVAEAGKLGDIDYWLEVASRSRQATPDIHFVGLCMAGAKCVLPLGGEARFTLLNFMDPVQTHALTVAARQNGAFVFRGSRPDGALHIEEDSTAVISQLTSIVNRKDKKGGA